MRNLILTVLVLGLLCVAGVGLYFFDFMNTPAGGEQKTEVFLVQPSSFSAVASRLESLGVIKDAKLFTLYARVVGKVGAVKIGEYELNTSMTPKEVLEVITSGKSMSYPITFKEGLNMYEIAEMLEVRGFTTKKDFLDLCRDRAFVKQLLGVERPSLEGYLFPNTYMFTKFTGTQGIVKEMVRQFQSAWQEVQQENHLVEMKDHDAVILASIIEKETGVPEERRLVSSVFHNRLKKGMMLQTDPTIIYGILDKTGVMPTNIRKSDILAPTRYNTYTFRGLPYGPISNPGKASLSAAFSPEESEFLFFVSKNDGTHVFTTNYKDHQKAVQEFQLNRKAREGRSWREYSEKQKSN